MLRSEPMKHGTLILPADHAREFVDMLGAHGLVQLEDMNASTFLRPYRTYVQRFTEMERLLRFVRDEIRSLPGWEEEISSGDVESFMAHQKEYSLSKIEEELRRFHSEFMTLKENLKETLMQRNSTIEALYVARLASCFHAPQQALPSGGLLRRVSEELPNIGFLRQLSPPSAEEEARRNADTFESQALMRPLRSTEYGSPSGGGIDAIAGTVTRDDQARFSRALFRAARGKILTHFVEIQEPLTDPKTNKATFKSVFVIYFQSQIMLRSPISAMREKIGKVCSAFDAHVHPWNPDQASAETAKKALQQQVTEQSYLVEQVRQYMRQEGRRLIERVSYPDGNSLIEEWRMFCAKEKAIYATLNCFEGKTSLRSSCWYPASQENFLRTALTLQASRAMLVTDQLQPQRKPPTYIRRNEFTAVIQVLVDTYGVPRYREANPALFSIVTFPFLFGVMYGDVGHGLFLFCVGLVLCMYAQDIQRISPELYMSRYLITMMGFFATYAGLLYNDFFSIGLNLFGSRWRSPSASWSGEFVPTYDVNNTGGYGPYPFGLDPAWHGAVNELMFANSLKMKLSVIVGVVHMIVGVLLRFANAFHERNLIDFVFECVPMMVFLLCFFGFMDAMILFKWVTPLKDYPSIINSMICMALPMNKDKAPMFGETLPRYMMLATLASVFWMLFPKPFILSSLHQSRGKTHSSTEASQITARAHEDFSDDSFAMGVHAERGGVTQNSPLLAQPEENGAEFNFSEALMHQIIETIEYTLGTVSHTASYLRLWALSLAHQQLSHVFFAETLGIGLNMKFPFNGIVLYVMFVVWLTITIAILLGMDVLECTLHTLRLHWVEFQSKFYKADGYPFEPYSHKLVLSQMD